MGLLIIYLLAFPKLRTSNLYSLYMSSPSLIGSPYNGEIVAIDRRSRPKIPRSLIFIHTKLRSLEDLPLDFRNNVHQTIAMFRSAWAQDGNGMMAPVHFLNDTSCAAAIEKTEPRLLKYYQSPDTEGKFQADICRVAYLYIHGGYYFDIDMRTVGTLQLPDNVTFSSAITDDPHGNFDSHGPFFQSILASAPQHPILGKALEMMLGYYNGTLEICQASSQWVGPCTLRSAYDSISSAEKDSVRILRESNLDSRKHHNSYPNVTRQRGRGCCCNFVVHDDTLKEVYFFSRIVGAGRFCRAT